MNIAVTFRHIDSSDAIRQYAESKISKLEKYFNNIIEAHITLSMERVDHKESGVAHVKIAARNLTINAEEKSSDIYSAIDLLMEKVEAQVKKHKEKIYKKEHIGVSSEAASEGELSDGGFEIKDEYERQPMTADEAAAKLKKKNKDFIIFKDKESSLTTFMVKDKNGSLLLIAPEF